MNPEHSPGIIFIVGIPFQLIQLKMYAERQALRLKGG
jgi:hypothetical protein